jgi:hypothetical protein
MILIYSNSTKFTIVFLVYGNISFVHMYRIFILINQWFIRYVVKKFNTMILKYNILCVNKIPHVNKINKLLYSFVVWYHMISCTIINLYTITC